MNKKFTSKLGYEATIGKFAQQADSSVWLQQGGTVVLTTLVTEQASEFPGFLPLTVDYREQFAAAGRIPGADRIRPDRFPAGRSRASPAR